MKAKNTAGPSPVLGENGGRSGDEKGGEGSSDMPHQHGKKKGKMTLRHIMAVGSHAKAVVHLLRSEEAPLHSGFTDHESLLTIIKSFQGKDCWKPRVPCQVEEWLGGQLTFLRDGLTKIIQNKETFVKVVRSGGSQGSKSDVKDLKEACTLDKLMWNIALFVEMYQLTMLLYGMVAHHCTCPIMDGSLRLLYKWIPLTSEDNDVSPTCSASDYVTALQNNCTSYLDSVARQDGGDLTKGGPELVDNFQKRLFRIYSHVMFRHRGVLEMLSMENPFIFCARFAFTICHANGTVSAPFASVNPQLLKLILDDGTRSITQSLHNLKNSFARGQSSEVASCVELDKKEVSK